MGADNTESRPCGVAWVSGLQPQCPGLPTECSAKAQDSVAEQATRPARPRPMQQHAVKSKRSPNRDVPAVEKRERRAMGAHCASSVQRRKPPGAAQRRRRANEPHPTNPYVRHNVPMSKPTRAQRSAENKARWAANEATRIENMRRAKHGLPPLPDSGNNATSPANRTQRRDATSSEQHHTESPAGEQAARNETTSSPNRNANANSNTRHDEPNDTNSEPDRRCDASRGRIKDATPSSALSPPSRLAASNASDRPRSGCIAAETLPDPPPPLAKNLHSPPISPVPAVRQEDEAGDIRWAMEHLHDEEEPEVSPSRTALSLLRFARSSPKAMESFVTQVYGKVFVRREEEEQEKLDRTRRVRIEGMVERCLEMAGQVKSGG